MSKKILDIAQITPNIDDYSGKNNELSTFVGQKIEITKVKKVASLVHKDEDMRPTVTFSFIDEKGIEREIMTSSKNLVAQLLKVMKEVPNLGEDKCEYQVMATLGAKKRANKWTHFYLGSAEDTVEEESED